MHLGVMAVPLPGPEVLGVFSPKAPCLPPACNTWLGGACKGGQGQLAYTSAKCTLSVQWKASTYLKCHRDSQPNQR